MKNLFRKNELKLLWPFYASSLLNILMIFSAFFVVYMKSIDFSLFQIGVFMSIMSLSQIIFEIPTGAIADIRGRKFSTLSGYFLMGFAFILAFFTTEFYFLCGLFLIFGIANTLVSGANDAWVVDLIKTKRDNKLISNYFEKIQSFSNFSMLFSGFLGAYFVKQFGLEVIWIVSGSQFILMAIILSFAKENFKKRNIKNYWKETKIQSKKAYRTILKNSILSNLFLASLFIAIASTFSMDLTWQPLLLNLGLNPSLFGILFSATFLLGIFAPFISKRLAEKLGGTKRYLIICLSIMSLLLFLVGTINTLLFAIILYLLFMTSLDFYFPIQAPFFHSFVPNKMRATIGSFESLTFSLAGAVIYPLVGFLADIIGPKYTIVLGGVAIIPAIIFYSRINESKSK